MLKRHSAAYNANFNTAIADNGSIFIRLAVVGCLLPPKSAKPSEILRKFELIQRSSILVSIESSYATSY